MKIKQDCSLLFQEYFVILPEFILVSSADNNNQCCTHLEVVVEQRF